MLKNKVALITGSARGLGKAIAQRYGSLGASVIVNYSTDEKSAHDTVDFIESAGGTAMAIQADVSKVADIDRLFDTSLARFGKLDIVVANAGIELIDQPVIDFTEEQFDRLFAVNTKGTFFTLQRAAKCIADNGRILYIGSSTTAFALPGCGLYGASKMAPRYLVEVLAKELGARGVAVNSILPTAIANAGVFTNGANAHIEEWVKTFRPMKRMGTVEDVADAAEYFAGDLAAFVSGQHLMLSGGAHT